MVRVHAVGQRNVVLAKAHQQRVGLGGFQAHVLEHAARADQAGLEHFALHLLDAQVAQFVPVREVAGTRHDFEVRKMLARQRRNLERCARCIHRQHQHARLGGARRAQQVQARGIAIKNAVAKGARHFQDVDAVVQHRGGNALGQQHARHDLPVAAKPRDQHGRCLRFGDFTLGRRAQRGGKARQHEAVEQHQKQRRAQHGQRHRADQQRGHVAWQRPGARGGLEHHKGKFPALRQQQRKHRALLVRDFHGPCQRINHHAFDRHKAGEQQGHHERSAQHGAKVDAHAHGNEEQAQQQAFEGLDIRLQLAPELALGQQHTGQKSPQRHRQADQHHQVGNADYQQQRCCGKDLGRAAAGNPAQQRAQQQATTEDDGGDHADDLEGFECRGAGCVGCARRTGRAQHRHQRQDGDGRNVLVQQDGKRRLTTAGAQQVAFSQRLQGNGGGRQRQSQATHQRHAPGQAGEQGRAAQQQRAAEHLRRAQSKNGPAQAPQPRRLQLQPHEEQHQHHTKLGKVQDVLHIAHPPEAPGPDGNAGRKVANDGAQPQRARHGHRQYGGGQVEKSVVQPVGRVGHGFCYRQRRGMGDFGTSRAPVLPGPVCR